MQNRTAVTRGEKREKSAQFFFHWFLVFQLFCEGFTFCQIIKVESLYFDVFFSLKGKTDHLNDFYV